MLEASHRYFHKGADLFDLEDKLRSILLTPNRVIKSRTGARGCGRQDPPPCRLSGATQQPPWTLQGWSALSPGNG